MGEQESGTQEHTRDKKGHRDQRHWLGTWSWCSHTAERDWHWGGTARPTQSGPTGSSAKMPQCHPRDTQRAGEAPQTVSHVLLVTTSGSGWAARTCVLVHAGMTEHARVSEGGLWSEQMRGTGFVANKSPSLPLPGLAAGSAEPRGCCSRTPRGAAWLTHLGTGALGLLRCGDKVGHQEKHIVPLGREETLNGDRTPSPSHCPGSAAPPFPRGFSSRLPPRAGPAAPAGAARSRPRPTAAVPPAPPPPPPPPSAS